MNAPAELRLPPHSIEAEQCVLGALLLDNNAWDKIADIVGEADFYRDDHRRLFRHIAVMCNGGKAFDAVTLHASLEKSNELDQIGGLAYLGEIANATPSAANIRRYAEIVRETSVRRKIISAADEIAAAAFSPAGKNFRALLDQAETKFIDIAEAEASAGSDPEELGKFLNKAVEEIEVGYNRDGDFTGLSTGLMDLDKQICGLDPGDVIVIAGRPSMGKTALALNIAEHVGVEIRKPVAIFSLEMGGAQLSKRFLASVGEINHSRIRTGKLNDDEWDRMTEALRVLHQANIHIDETGALSVPQIRGRARRLARKCGGLGLIVIDYLQLITSTRNTDNRANDVAEISRGVKALAKEMGCPIILLSQLSRKVEDRGDKRPLMSDLRESGAIEQDADVIVLLYRAEYYHPDTPEKGIAEANVVKHRNGPTGKVDLLFKKEFSRFRDVDHAELAVIRAQSAPKRQGRGFREE